MFPSALRLRSTNSDVDPAPSFAGFFGYYAEV
jgi:hypothetical protein